MCPRLPLLQLRKASSEDAYNATVVGTHDFGVFAELDEYGVEGLVPASKLPDKMPAGTIQVSQSHPRARGFVVDEEDVPGLLVRHPLRDA